VKGGFVDLLSPLVKVPFWRVPKFPSRPPQPIKDTGDRRVIHFGPHLKRLPGFIDKKEGSGGSDTRCDRSLISDELTSGTSNEELDAVVVRFPWLVKTKARHHSFSQTIHARNKKDDDDDRDDDRDDDHNLRDLREVLKHKLRGKNSANTYVVDFEWEIFVPPPPHNTQEFVDSVIFGLNGRECCTGTCPTTGFFPPLDGFSVFYKELSASVPDPYPSVNVAKCCEDWDSFTFNQEQYGKGRRFFWVGVIGNKSGKVEVRGRAYKRRFDEESIFFSCSSFGAPANNATCPAFEAPPDFNPDDFN